jgi:glucose-1-phosphate thymidylyltransferase
VLRQPKNKGEYYLTDAFQYMIDHGARIRVIDVDAWYDAGKLDTLIETNRVMLERGRARTPGGLGEDARIVEPVYIEDGVTITDSLVGPNVSIGAGSVISNSTLRDTIVGADARILNSTLAMSMIGDAAVVDGVRGQASLGDHAEVRAGE